MRRGITTSTHHIASDAIVEFGDHLAKGGHSSIRKGTLLLDGKRIEVAIKVLLNEPQKGRLSLFENEIEMLKFFTEEGCQTLCSTGDTQQSCLPHLTLSILLY